jgi:ribosomal protein L39E
MAPDPKVEILLHLRAAAANARIAAEVEVEAEKAYEEKMKSAGASVFAAFRAAVDAAPEFAGRRIDDDRLAKLYQSNKPRPWWDRYLAQVKVAGKPASREWAARTMQWYVDPDAAKSRRAKDTALSAANRLKLKANNDGHGRRRPQPADGPARRDIDKVNAAVEDAAHEGRELAQREPDPEPDLSLDDLLGEVNRISSAARRVAPEDRATVLAILKTAAREIERYS